MTAQIQPGADAAEIRRQYRKLARELHPDMNPNNKEAEERFIRSEQADPDGFFAPGGATAGGIFGVTENAGDQRGRMSWRQLD